MKKILSIVGARPQFIKAAALSPKLRESFSEVLLHTGQHYDTKMSDVFFADLNIPAPDYSCDIHGGSPSEQTGRMLIEIEKIALKERPDYVLVYGDTTSTLAGAIVAAKLGVCLTHVEAGLRSYNRKMPEEVNRLLTDHISDILLVPSKAAEMNLTKEGLNKGVHIVGDIMLDLFLQKISLIEDNKKLLDRMKLEPDQYSVLTLHRAENVDSKERLSEIFSALAQLPTSLLFPIHPRTRQRIKDFGIQLGKNIQIVEPLGYGEMMQVCHSAEVIFTDSGGLQKEAYFLGVPCLTLRTETEWTETVDTGWNLIAGNQFNKLGEFFALAKVQRGKPQPSIYGEGNAAERILKILSS